MSQNLLFVKNQSKIATLSINFTKQTHKHDVHETQRSYPKTQINRSF